MESLLLLLTLAFVAEAIICWRSDRYTDGQTDIQTDRGWPGDPSSGGSVGPGWRRGRWWLVLGWSVEVMRRRGECCCLMLIEASEARQWQPPQYWSYSPALAGSLTRAGKPHTQILHQAKLSDFVNLKRLLRHGDFNLLFIRENICSGGDSWQLVPVTAAWRLQSFPVLCQSSVLGLVAILNCNQGMLTTPPRTTNLLARVASCHWLPSVFLSVQVTDEDPRCV